jgi:hypothetical protein
LAKHNLLLGWSLAERLALTRSTQHTAKKSDDIDFAEFLLHMKCANVSY